MYTIRAVGIDLSPVHSAAVHLTLQQGTWGVAVVDAATFHVPQGPKFPYQYRTADSLVNSFVNKHHVDIVGIEDYTNQPKSFVSFSTGQMGGITRTMLLRGGHRILNISPMRYRSFALTKGDFERRKTIGKAETAHYKQVVIDWVKKYLHAEFEGTSKEVSDMADACVYAMIAACFYSFYWLDDPPPLSWRQQQMFYSGSRNKTGFLDRSYAYLYRDIEAEVKRYGTYATGLLKQPDTVDFSVGDEDV